MSQRLDKTTKPSLFGEYKNTTVSKDLDYFTLGGYIVTEIEELNANIAEKTDNKLLFEKIASIQENINLMANLYWAPGNISATNYLIDLINASVQIPGQIEIMALFIQQNAANLRQPSTTTCTPPKAFELLEEATKKYYMAILIKDHKTSKSIQETILPDEKYGNNMDSLLKTISGYLVRFKIPPKTYLDKMKDEVKAECDKLYQQQTSPKAP